MHASQRAKLSGRGGTDKTAVAGIRDRATKQIRAQVVKRLDRDTPGGFVVKNTDPSAPIITDDTGAHDGIPGRHAVRHSVGEYVRGMVHTNRIESFWSMLKRAHMGTFHKLSPKHLQRYVSEFTAKRNIRDADTVTQMTSLVAGLVGKRLMYRDLVADNGLDSGARA